MPVYIAWQIFKCHFIRIETMFTRKGYLSATKLGDLLAKGNAPSQKALNPL